jgi:predicted DNA binding CopG/RHH family protein
MVDLIAQETGEVITPEMMEALVAEAEEGYDLSVATPVRVGRPALAGGASASPRITIRTAPQLYKAIQDRAAADGRSVSDVARDALEAYVSR